MQTIENVALTRSPLGKKATYIETYTPTLLYPIPRSFARSEYLPHNTTLPFVGQDIWNAYEISWLNPKGKPCLAAGEFIVPAESEYLIESKSLKLYLNSFNLSLFSSQEEVAERIREDLSRCTKTPVDVKLIAIEEWNTLPFHQEDGVCLDHLDIDVHQYHVDTSLLKLKTNDVVSEKLYTNLFKANCRVTGQPDWASVYITYRGKALCHESLLKYLMSFRKVQEFHEPAVEKIFVDIQNFCQSEFLSVYARFTRRGGLNINPWRATQFVEPSPARLWHQ